MNFRPLPLMEPRNSKYFLLFETSLTDKDNFRSYIFTEPLRVFKAYDLSSAEKHLKAASLLAKRYCIAGYFSYEFGYAFEETFRNNKKYSFPLLHLAVFNKPAIFDHRTGKFNGSFPIKAAESEEFNISAPKFNETFATYKPKIEKIKEYIRRGDTYQVNFTGKLRFNFEGSPFAFYQNLKLKQPVAYSAFLKMGDEHLVSLSPELFFKRDGKTLISKPMKGTIKRGKTAAEDRALIQRLRTSLKERAENLMIVDLMRNDIGRISEPGSVSVSKLFEVERYNTLFQMTSTVKGRVIPNIGLYEVFRKLFPGGSITGAPKIRTMEIIKGLEREPRKAYCGALGFTLPGDKAAFNIPIRTVYLKGNKGELGIGSGVTYDSNAKKEYNECILKARFLTKKYVPFELLETMLWDKGYFMLKEHLKRISDSSEYFSSKFSKPAAEACLRNAEKHFLKGDCYRVRLLVSKDGSCRTEYSEITETLKIGYIAISKRRTNTANTFLYHKTTNRKLYNEEYAKYSALGYTDAVFLNEKGELTEGAISNIFIKKKGGYFTPPLSSGLLCGIMRARLLMKLRAVEKPLYLDDLNTADKVFVCNSVRGIIEVKLR
ncbi:MAG: aminodeoxychorismate synthase component I [Candidatus Firestonebacteria bacterium]